MLEKIHIENFKSIGEPGVDLNLKPITILVGPNGAGKSNILEAIALLSQSINKDLQSTGELLDYPRISYFYHKNNPKLCIRFAVSTYVTGKLAKYSYQRKFTPNEYYKQCVSMEDKEICAYIEYTDGNTRNFRLKGNWYDKLSNPRVQPNILLNESVFSSPHKDVHKMIKFARDTVNMLRPLLSNVFLISVGRGRIPYTDQVQTLPRWVGRHGEFLIPRLTYLYNNPDFFPIRDKIVLWASKFGLNNLFSGWKGDYDIRSHFRDDKFNVDIDLSLAGFGSKQIISIITQLFYCPSNSIILLEEPEVSLHPNNQALLPELFADAIKEDKQIIITTHSEFLLLSPYLSIKKGLLTSDDIAVYHIKKEKDVGTTATRLELTKDGFVKNWVPSFADIEIKLFKEWFASIPEEE